MDTVDSFNFNMLWSIFYGLISLVVFGACVYYVIVKPALDSVLLAIGSFIQLSTSLFYSIGIVILSSLGGDFYGNGILNVVVRAIGIIGNLCFTSGFIILLINYVQLLKKQSLAQL